MVKWKTVLTIYEIRGHLQQFSVQHSICDRLLYTNIDKTLPNNYMDQCITK